MQNLKSALLQRMRCPNWVGAATYERFPGVIFLSEDAVSSLSINDSESLNNKSDFLVRVIPHDERMGLRLDLAGKSVAIVGNGDVKHCGKAIDDHDQVLRINGMRNWKQDPIHDGRRTTVWTGYPVFVVSKDKSGMPQAIPPFSDLVTAGVDLWALSPLHISISAYRWLISHNALEKLVVAPPSAIIQDLSSQSLERNFVSTLFSIPDVHDEIVGRSVFEHLLTGTRLLFLLELCGVRHISLYGFGLFVNSSDPVWYGHDLRMDMRVILDVKRRLLEKGGFWHWEEESLVLEKQATLQRAFRSGYPLVGRQEKVLQTTGQRPRPSNKVALILNDTALYYHYGCFATSTALADLLRDDGYDVATCPVTTSHEINTTPASADDLQSSNFFEKFFKSQPSICQRIQSADIIVINGEGTLHGFGPAPRNLLYLAMVARRYYNRPTYLVNHSLFPSDKKEIIEDVQAEYYKQALRELDGIAAREPLTLALYAKFGIEAVQSFDLLPLFAQHSGVTAESENRDPFLVVVGVGVGWDAALGALFAQTLKHVVPDPFRLIFLNGGPNIEPLEERSCLPVMAEIDPRIRSATPFTGCMPTHHARTREWLRTIARAGLIITGRFHQVIAALVLGTPVVPLSSHTCKIEGALKLIGFGEAVLDPRSEGFRERLEAALSGALRGMDQAIVTSAAQRQHLCNLTLANAIWRR